MNDIVSIIKPFFCVLIDPMAHFLLNVAREAPEPRRRNSVESSPSSCQLKVRGENFGLVSTKMSRNLTKIHGNGII